MLRRLIEENAFLYSCTSGIRNIFIDKNGFVIKVRSDYGAFKFYFACFFLLLQEEQPAPFELMNFNSLDPLKSLVDRESVSDKYQKSKDVLLLAL